MQNSSFHFAQYSVVHQFFYSHIPKELTYLKNYLIYVNQIKRFSECECDLKIIRLLQTKLIVLLFLPICSFIHMRQILKQEQKNENDLALSISIFA